MLDVLQRLEAWLREIAPILEQLIERGMLLPRHSLQRSAHDHRELQALGLVDRQERDTAFGRVFRIVLVLTNAAVTKKAQESVEQIPKVFLQVLGVQHADIVQILELGEQLGEGSEVARGAPLVHALHGLRGEEAREHLGTAAADRTGRRRRSRCSGSARRGAWPAGVPSRAAACFPACAARR
jgi:hypothetical protein